MFFRLSGFFFSYFAIIGVYVVFMPKILELFHYTPFQIGIVYALSPLIRFLIPFFFLKHIKLNRKIYNYALILSLMSAISFYFTIENIYLFIISNIFLGIALGLVLPYVETYSMEYLKKERYGKSRLYGSIGFILIAIVLAKYLNINFKLGIDFFLFAIFLMVAFGFSISKDKNFKKNHTKERENSFFDIAIHKNLWISIILMQVSFGAFYNFFTIYEYEYGIDYKTISYLWSFGVICEIILFNYQAKLFKYNLLNLIKFSIFITSIRWLLLFLFPTNLPILYLSQSFHAFSFALYHTATLNYLYKLYKDKKLASQFYYGFSFGAGGFLGSILSGYLYGKHLYLISSLIAFVAFLFLFKPIYRSLH